MTVAGLGVDLDEGLGQLTVRFPEKGSDFQHQDAGHHLQGCGAVAAARVHAGCNGKYENNRGLNNLHVKSEPFSNDIFFSFQLTKLSSTSLNALRKTSSMATGQKKELFASIGNVK